ncbi:acyltransferase family protein [Pseudarthrobacter sp. So.54]
MRSKSGQTRVTQLDGLRGIAALVVVACHVLSTLPGIGSVVEGDRSAGLSTAGEWAVFSPLHILWNGTPAVHVFFVLSGFVLVLPFTRPGATGWGQYYAKRFFRLYLLSLGVPDGGGGADFAHSPHGVAPAEPVGGHVCG